MSNKLVVAFAFGAPCSINPNTLLCAQLNDLIHQYDQYEKNHSGKLYIVSQKALIGLPSLLDKSDQVTIDYVPSGNRPHPTTLEIARYIVQYAQTVKPNDGILVACAPPHKGRVIRDFGIAQKELKTNFKTKYADERDNWFYKAEQWFDKESAQWHTRSSFNWQLYETIISLFLMWFYRLLAG